MNTAKSLMAISLLFDIIFTSPACFLCTTAPALYTAFASKSHHIEQNPHIDKISRGGGGGYGIYVLIHIEANRLVLWIKRRQVYKITN